MTETIQKAMDELGEAVTGLQVRHRGRVVLLQPIKAGDPRGKWSAVVEVDAEDEESEGDIALGYGDTTAQALDDAVDQAEQLEGARDEFLERAQSAASSISEGEGEDE